MPRIAVIEDTLEFLAPARITIQRGFCVGGHQKRACGGHARSAAAGKAGRRTQADREHIRRSRQAALRASMADGAADRHGRVVEAHPRAGSRHPIRLRAQAYPCLRVPGAFRCRQNSLVPSMRTLGRRPEQNATARDIASARCLHLPGHLLRGDDGRRRAMGRGDRDRDPGSSPWHDGDDMRGTP